MSSWHTSCYITNNMWYTTNKNLRYSYQVKDNELVFKFELAGKSKEDVKVYNDKGSLSIKVDNKDYYVVDSKFYDLDDFDFSASTATMKNGLLTVKVPVKEESKSQEIKIE